MAVYCQMISSVAVGFCSTYDITVCHRESMRFGTNFGSVTFSRNCNVQECVYGPCNSTDRLDVDKKNTYSEIKVYLLVYR